jgi:hypothetical protein
MHPIAVRIIEGESVCAAEIREYNASWIMSWVKDTDRHHTQETCRQGKHCVHAPGQDYVDHAARLVNEMHDSCTCGQHRRTSEPEGTI